MRELTPQAAVELVFDRGLCRFSDRPRATMLTGGVSSNVVLVETDHPDQRWVLKQPCAKLKVAADWQCSVERIWREVEVLEICGKLLAEGDELAQRCGIHVPEIVFTDRENYVYAMTAAPAGSEPWKELLLGGSFDASTAELCGTMLGRLHGKSWQDPEIGRRLDDREFFEKLRIEPYYLHVSQTSVSCAAELTELIQGVRDNRWALVHGDFSPKNLLVSHGQATLIDFEVGHYGDPAFDLGFFLTHLVCKEVHYSRNTATASKVAETPSPLDLADRFWTVYRETIHSRLPERDPRQPFAFHELELRAMQNLGGCLLARVDGKSPLDYLATEEDRYLIRGLGGAILLSPIRRWSEVRCEMAKSAAR